MIALLKFEAKKLYQHKLSILLLTLLLILPFVEVFIAYSTLTFPGNTMNLKQEAGKTLYYGEESYQGIKALQVIDEQQHSYASDITETWYQNLEEKRDTERKKAELKKEIDVSFMIRNYGEQWESLYEKSLQGVLTKGEVLDAQLNAGVNVEERVLTQEERDAITYLYTMETQASEEREQALHYLFPDVFISYYIEPEKFLITKEKMEYQKAYAENKNSTLLKERASDQRQEYDEEQRYFTNGGDDQRLVDMMNERYLNKSTIFDSSIAVEWWIQIMNQQVYFAPFAFLLMGLLLLSVFNQEVSSRMDQIIRPVAISQRKQSLCKSIFILLHVMGLLIYYLAVYYIILQVMVGFHDLDIVFNHSLIIATTITEYLFTCKEILLAGSIAFLGSGLLLSGLIVLISSLGRKSHTSMIIYLFVLGIVTGIPVLYRYYYGIPAPWSPFMPTMMARPDTLFTMMNFIPYREEIIIANQNFLLLGNRAVFSLWITIPCYLLLGCFLHTASMIYQRKREIKNK